MPHDDPMTADELGAYTAARYRQLIRRGLRGGPGAVQQKVQQLTDEDARWLLTVAISAEVQRLQAAVHHTINAANN